MDGGPGLGHYPGQLRRGGKSDELTVSRRRISGSDAFVGNHHRRQDGTEVAEPPITGQRPVAVQESLTLP